MQFSTLLDEIHELYDQGVTGYPIPKFPRYNQIIGNIKQGQLTTIGGLPSAGKTSFMDHNYVMNPLISWYETSKDTVDLQIKYISLKASESKKLKNMLCNYIMDQHQERIDVNTLTNSASKRFDLTQNDTVLSYIEGSEDFFDGILDNNLHIEHRYYQPTSLNNSIREFIEQFGSFEDDGTFEYNDNSTEIIIAIDSMELLTPDQSFQDRITQRDVYKLALQYLNEIKTIYNVHIVLTFEIDRRSNYGLDNIPSHKQLGEFAAISDVATIIYNPIAEGTFHNILSGADPMAYIFGGQNYMRYWYVVKNNAGADAAKERFLLLGGASFQTEFPVLDMNAEVTKDEIVATLFKK